ncbi:MAG: LytTR family transcriptional regulator [Bacteroidales bacterium]|nr:LytTR family transcriptional regulator [Bacteroidales bacterium]
MEESSNKTIKAIVFKTSFGYIFFDYSEIIMCCADGNNTIIFTTLNESYVKILHRIAYIEKRYQNDKFLRCHKSYMINLVYLENCLSKPTRLSLKVVILYHFLMAFGGG